MTTDIQVLAGLEVSWLSVVTSHDVASLRLAQGIRASLLPDTIVSIR